MAGYEVRYLTGLFFLLCSPECATVWKSVRVVYGEALEMPCAAMYREFESLLFLQGVVVPVDVKKIQLLSLIFGWGFFYLTFVS